MRAHPLVVHRSAPPAPVAPLTSAGPRGPFAPLAPRTRKPFTRRRGDVSQRIRFAVQLVFGAIALWAGVQFVMWVRYFESGGTTLRVERPDGVEAWLPIASLMNLKVFILTRTV